MTNQPNQPTLTPAEFFALPEVAQIIEIQKATPYGTPKRIEAEKRLLQIAAEHGVEEYFAD
jgi:hypothetical protein